MARKDKNKIPTPAPQENKWWKDSVKPELFESNRFQTLKKRPKETTSLENLLKKYGIGLDSPGTVLSDVRNNRAEYFSMIEDGFEDPTQLRLLSRGMYASNGAYSRMVDYLSGMYMIRYKTIPIRIRDFNGSGPLKEVYNEMIQVTEGANLESMIPYLIKELYLDGAVYFATRKDTSSNTTITLVLPTEYCRTISKTNFSTNMIEFNCEFFDDFEEEMQENEADFWGQFPKELRAAYERYQSADKETGDTEAPEWQPLDPRYATSIMANEFGIPPLISTALGVGDYDAFQELELQRVTDALQQILTHEIPLYEGEPIFSLPVIRGIQNAMEDAVEGRSNAKVLQTFGKTELLNVDTNASNAEDKVQSAFQNIFRTGGLNSTLFSGESVEAIKTSIKIDAGTVWSYIQQIMKFYNLTINNLFNFREFQADITMLKINIHSESDDKESYLNSAIHGIGRLDAVIASGMKQTTMTTQLELEQELELDAMLIPLGSAHTTVGGTANGGEGTQGTEGTEGTETKTEESSSNIETETEGGADE